MENPESQTENIKQKPEYPKGLTEKDIQLINTQCELQVATSKEQIEGFAQAYKEAKDLAASPDRFGSLTGEDIKNLILHFSVLIEKINENGYRIVPVSFDGGGTPINPELIDRAMYSFSRAYAEHIMESIDVYPEFEKIHPFTDGNGRLGHLLWAMDVTRKTGQWPEELPPDVFHELDDKENSK